MYVYHPVFSYIKKIINSKKYGKLNYVISNFRYPSLPNKKNNNRYNNKEGDGFFYDAASYLISLETYLFDYDNKKKFKSHVQKIKKNVDLRGNIFINSSNIRRFYFWGEGQNYTNNLEIFFNNATIYVNKFFSKSDDEKIIVKIFSKNIKEKIIKKTNHFKKMFSIIQKKYNNQSFQKSHRNKIKKQLDFLTKYNI